MEKTNESLNEYLNANENANNVNDNVETTALMTISENVRNAVALTTIGDIIRFSQAVQKAAEDFEKVQAILAYKVYQNKSLCGDEKFESFCTKNFNCSKATLYQRIHVAELLNPFGADIFGLNLSYSALLEITLAMPIGDQDLNEYRKEVTETINTIRESDVTFNLAYANGKITRADMKAAIKPYARKKPVKAAKTAENEPKADSTTDSENVENTANKAVKKDKATEQIEKLQADIIDVIERLKAAKCTLKAAKATFNNLCDKVYGKQE